MKWVSVYLLICASLPAQTWVSNGLLGFGGRISGLVLNELQQPVPGIMVVGLTFYPPGALVGKMIRTNARTDAQGRFVLAGLLMTGLVSVYASNEDAFYPEALSNIWDGQSSVLVKAPVGGQASGVVLVLNPAGRLEVTARNATTGDVIDRINVHIERDGESNRTMGGSNGGNSWLVPTAPIRVCIAAEGFGSAWYGGDGSFGRSVPLKLSPRQVFTAIVSLRPENGAPLDADGSCFRGRNR